MSFLDQPLQSVLVGPSRKIGSIAVDCILNESTQDKLTITKQPVQQGAAITDHSFKEPTSMSMAIIQKGNIGTTLEKIYQNFLDLQNTKVPFDILTPKRFYKDMLIEVIGLTTDKNTENILALNLVFQKVIIVKVSTVQVARRQQKNAGNTGGTENAGKKSALVSGKEAIQTLIPSFLRPN